MIPQTVIGDDLASLFLASLLRESRPVFLIRSVTHPGMPVNSDLIFPILPSFTLSAPPDFPAISADVTITLGPDSFPLPRDPQRFLEFLCDTLGVPPRTVLILAKSHAIGFRTIPSIFSLFPEKLFPLLETLLLPFSHAPLPFLDTQLLSGIISSFRPAFYTSCSLTRQLVNDLRSSGVLIEDSAISVSSQLAPRRLIIRTSGGLRILTQRAFWGSSRLAYLYSISRSSRLLPCLVYGVLDNEICTARMEFVRVDPRLPPWGNNFFVFAILPYEQGFSRFASPRVIAYSLWSHRKWSLALRQGLNPGQSLVDFLRSRFPSFTVHSVLSPAEFESHPLRHTAFWGSFHSSHDPGYPFWKRPRFLPPGISLWQPGIPEADIGAYFRRVVALAS
ncbi:MAG: hypothetical protein V2G42_03285 [bacterium JZ-2024 1]